MGEYKRERMVRQAAEDKGLHARKGYKPYGTVLGWLVTDAGTGEVLTSNLTLTQVEQFVADYGAVKE